MYVRLTKKILQAVKGMLPSPEHFVRDAVLAYVASPSPPSTSREPRRARGSLRLPLTPTQIREVRQSARRHGLSPRALVEHAILTATAAS